MLIPGADGFAKSWQTLAGLRVPLGAFEGFLFPGSIFLISSWYPRYETQKRVSAFYLGGASFSGFSNIIAYGFVRAPSVMVICADDNFLVRDGGSRYLQWSPHARLPMDLHQLASISSGICAMANDYATVMALMTIVAALIGYCVIPNFPAKATFLTPEEHQLVQDRINVDRRDFENEKLTKAGVFGALSDPKIWAMGLLFLCSTLPAYAFSYFLVIILAGFGYSSRDSQLLSAPP